jgi:hypothetical protein
MIKPPDVFELPLLERAALAMKAAMEEVIEEHAREGLPLYIWRDGQVVRFLPKSFARNPEVRP